jgi:arylsulfatase A-like enzyme
MAADERPNIVFILADNQGWGDWSCYGGRTPTPRIDKLAEEGIRFTNYGTECQCTPSRSAILTGRQSVRCGTYTVPWPGQGKNGLCPWEYTIAELLSDAGYATSLWGKWHCGDTEGRLPTDQGFDEWWGYRNSADESGWTSYAAMRELAKKGLIYTPMLWEGQKGGEQTAERVLDLAVRPLLDELIVEKTNAYIKRQANGEKPFFTYVGLSHMHPPEAVHPDFDQTDPSRLGEYADVMAEQDYRVGQIVDCIEQAGIRDNTLIVFSSDNATGGVDTRPATGGSNGPFRGNFFNQPFEGSYRTGAIVNWPGKVPGGVVTDEMLSVHDWYKTFAAIAAASDKVPTDRPLDGVDASQFLLGKSKTTGRETYMFVGPDGEPWAAKAKSLKAIFKYSEGMGDPIVKPQLPMFFDLESDPHEDFNLLEDKLDMGWMFGIALSIVEKYEKSIAEYPNIKPGAEFHGYDQDTAQAHDGAGGAQAQPAHA